jgi:Acetoacetate decarboxylase (ADC)
MVTYISRPDDPDIPPPYEFPGITIMSFRLPASLPSLQVLCDQMLNIGTLPARGFEYRAFLDFVDMEIVTYPKMLFAEPPYTNWGYASQQELYFRFYVWKFVLISGVLFPEPVPELFFPFMFVDNSWSMISGRNVIGFPKVMARFEPTPVLGADPFQICVSALALEKHSPATKLDWKPIVEINPTAELGPAPGGLWPWIELAADVGDPYLNQSLQALVANIPFGFSTVQLKQFRDGSSTDDACYQAVLATPFMPLNINVPAPLPAVTITVNPYESLNIADSLGFSPGVAMRPLLQFSVSLDMSMSKARTLFVNS